MHFRNFLKKNFKYFRKFSQRFPANSVFRPNAQKLNAGFVKFFEKYAKKSIFCNIHRKFFENFLKILEILFEYFGNFSKSFTKFLNFF